MNKYKYASNYIKSFKYIDFICHLLYNEVDETLINVFSFGAVPGIYAMRY